MNNHIITLHIVKSENLKDKNNHTEKQSLNGLKQIDITTNQSSIPIKKCRFHISSSCYGTNFIFFDGNLE
jgi:hypothetical protein